MLRYQDPNSSPPGNKFPYRDPETGEKFAHTSLNGLKLQVKAHRTGNNLPIGTAINEDIEDASCRQVIAEHPGYNGCVDSEGLTPFGKAGKVTMQMVSDAMNILYMRVMKGEEPISQEEANRRAAICITCPLNVDAGACVSCKLKGLMRTLKGGRKVAGENQLKACDACGCDLKTKVWFRKEAVYREGVEYPSFCWMNE